MLDTYAPSSALAGLAPDLKQKIEDLVKQNKVVVFMKGTRQFPQCGFSNTVVTVRNLLKLTPPMIR